MRLFPQSLGDLQRFDIEIMPPRHFITCLMQLLMVITAERHGEFIADLETQGTRLCETQMMRIARLTPTDKTGLRRNKPQVAFSRGRLG